MSILKDTGLSNARIGRKLLTSIRNPTVVEDDRAWQQILGEILEPRVEEVLNLVHREVFRASMEESITSGVVVTGGSCLLEGVIDIAESVFNLPTRIGKPVGIRGLVDVVSNPMYATAVGLVMYGAQSQPKKKFRIRDANIFDRVTARMKKWFKEII